VKRAGWNSVVPMSMERLPRASVRSLESDGDTARKTDGDIARPLETAGAEAEQKPIDTLQHGVGIGPRWVCSLSTEGRHAGTWCRRHGLTEYAHCRHGLPKRHTMTGCRVAAWAGHVGRPTPTCKIEGRPGARTRDWIRLVPRGRPKTNPIPAGPSRPRAHLSSTARQ